MMIRAYRMRGHLHANLDPLGFDPRVPDVHHRLDPRVPRPLLPNDSHFNDLMLGRVETGGLSVDKAQRSLVVAHQTLSTCGGGLYPF